MILWNGAIIVGVNVCKIPWLLHSDKTMEQSDESANEFAG